jgi:hypothetical protein
MYRYETKEFTTSKAEIVCVKIEKEMLDERFCRFNREGFKPLRFHTNLNNEDILLICDGFFDFLSRFEKEGIPYNTSDKWFVYYKPIKKQTLKKLKFWARWF